jgi:hypothetical protein
MITVKEATPMIHYNNYEDKEILSRDNFVKRLNLIRSLENYSNKLDKLIKQTSKIENISLKVGR